MMLAPKLEPGSAEMDYEVIMFEASLLTTVFFLTVKLIYIDREIISYCVWAIFTIK